MGDLKPPAISLANADDLLKVACPRCHLERVIQAKKLIRGMNYHCDGCGTHIQSAPRSDMPNAELTAAREGEVVPIKFIQRPDGIWVYLDVGEKSALATLDHDSERAIALVIGSMIENRLQRALVTKFQRDKKIEQEAFEGHGSLATFSAKINIAYLVGLITKDAHNELVTLKGIRNDFAHNLEIADFSPQKIKDRAANFKLIRSLVAEAPATTDGTQLFVNFAPTASPGCTWPLI